MSSGDRDRDERAEHGPAPELTGRLGYVFKHAWLRLTELTGAALEPYGVNGRDLAVMVVLKASEQASQLELARRLGVDRTTMVALLDGLERRGLVARRAHTEDRRKNVVGLTPQGRDVLEHATKAGEEAERRFLAPLGEDDAQRLRRSLQALARPGP
jgi:DNA-binding MarR family transcriptional regulator